MAIDRSKGSAESTVGNEMVRWQGVSFLSIELLD